MGFSWPLKWWCTDDTLAVTATDMTYTYRIAIRMHAVAKSEVTLAINVSQWSFFSTFSLWGVFGETWENSCQRFKTVKSTSDWTPNFNNLLTQKEVFLLDLFLNDCTTHSGWNLDSNSDELIIWKIKTKILNHFVTHQSVSFPPVFKSE